MSEQDLKQYLAATREAARINAEARTYIPGGSSRLHYYYEPYPIYARSGKGCRLVDVDGLERLDFLNNMTSLLHGHAHPAITRAITEQAQRGTAFSEPDEVEVALAKVMIERVASLKKIRFSNSGTEAVMMAIKLARAFTGRSCIAKFEGFYHGYYDYVQVSYASGPANWGAAAAPASVPSSGGLSANVPDEVLVLPFNDEATVAALLEKDRASVAALIVDPLSNRAGFPAPAPGFYKFLRDVTKRLGIVLIFDEVISFRVAYDGAQGKYGGEPDLTTFGKIIGGGLPVGAVGGSEEIMALLDPTVHAPKVVSGGTFSANPLTMAAGLAAMAEATPATYARLDALGERLRGRANEAFATAGVPAQLTGDGSLFRIMGKSGSMKDYRESIVGALPAVLMDRLHVNLLLEGVIVNKGGLGCLSTPMGEAEVDQFVAALERALAKIV
ncbi:MAG: aspartate aminotransferase family protein [Chloroflexota bacterium]